MKKSTAPEGCDCWKTQAESHTLAIVHNLEEARLLETEAESHEFIIIHAPRGRDR